MLTYIETKIPGRQPIKLVDYFDSFKWYYPNCELETKTWCVNNIQPDWNILDCGANIGYYSILFSQLSPDGQIFAFEPTPTVVKLENNLYFNKTDNVKVIKKALSNKVGNYIDDIYQVWGDFPLHDRFEFTTIDNFVLETNIDKIDLIKIDVDSYDFEVLMGAENTIKEYNLFIIVELNHALHLRNQNLYQVLKWMEGRGYISTEVYDTENFLFKKGMVSKSNNKITIFF